MGTCCRRRIRCKWLYAQVYRRLNYVYSRIRTRVNKSKEFVKARENLVRVQRMKCNFDETMNRSVSYQVIGMYEISFHYIFRTLIQKVLSFSGTLEQMLRNIKIIVVF